MNNTITLGKSGRMVIPKVIRENLGLREGVRLRIQVSAGKMQMEPLPDDEVRIEKDGKDGFPVIRGGQSREKGTTVEAIKAEREARDGRATKKNKTT